MQYIDPQNLHTTPMGARRIQRNLDLSPGADPVQWCRRLISSPGTVLTRRGKNIYASLGEIRITIHATALTIITAHRNASPEDML